MLGLGPTELLLILAVALIVFGPNKLPEIARTLGHSINELKSAASEVKDAIRFEEDEVKPARATQNPHTDTQEIPETPENTGKQGEARQ